MLLTNEIGDELENPTEEQLATVIHALNRGNAFAILESSSLEYVQAALDDKTGTYALEYQAGSIAEHYYAVQVHVSRRQVIEVFKRYWAGDPDWRGVVEWERGMPS